MFWIIKTRTWAVLTDVYSSEILRLFRTIIRTYYFRESKASYNCKDLGTISLRCSRAKTLTILQKCWFQLQSFHYFHNLKLFLTYSFRRSQGSQTPLDVYEVYTTKVTPEVNYLGVYTTNVTPIRKQTTLSYDLTANYKKFSS